MGLEIDKFSKFVMAKPVRFTTALNATHFLVKEIILKHGRIKELVMNRGTHFLGDIMQQVLKSLGMKHSIALRYHQASDGAAVRQIEQMKQIFSRCSNTDKHNWNKLVSSN